MEISWLAGRGEGISALEGWRHSRAWLSMVSMGVEEDRRSSMESRSALVHGAVYGQERVACLVSPKSSLQSGHRRALQLLASDHAEAWESREGSEWRRSVQLPPTALRILKAAGARSMVGQVSEGKRKCDHC